MPTLAAVVALVLPPMTGRSSQAPIRAPNAWLSRDDRGLEEVMRTNRLLIGVTLVNGALLALSLAQRSPAVAAGGVAPVLRGRSLEIVDERGRLRASITLQPADRSFKMPDGTTGYPETILFRLIDPNGRPNVKIQASEEGAGVGLGGESDPTYVSLGAKGTQASLQLTNRDGRRQVIAP